MVPESVIRAADSGTARLTAAALRGLVTAAWPEAAVTHVRAVPAVDFATASINKL